MKKKTKKSKPSGWFWKERTRLQKKYKCKISWAERTIFISWQIWPGAETEMKPFARKHGLKIQTTL